MLPNFTHKFHKLVLLLTNISKINATKNPPPQLFMSYTVPANNDCLATTKNYHSFDYILFRHKPERLMKIRTYYYKQHIYIYKHMHFIHGLSLDMHFGNFIFSQATTVVLSFMYPLCNLLTYSMCKNPGSST